MSRPEGAALVTGAARSGWRSALTAKTLQDMGFDTVAHLDGGFSAWKDSGQEIAQLEPRG
mgnify:CR=1 FL=1